MKQKGGVMLTIHKINGTGITCWVNARHFDNKKRSLLFIHGSGTDHTIWIHQYTEMKCEFNIVALDLPGHGRSEGKGEQDVSSYVEWVKKVINELNLGTPVLIGHSLGAAISLVFAIQYSDLIFGVVPVGGGVKMPVNEVILSGLKADAAAIIDFIAKFSVSKKNRERLSGYLSECFARVNPDILYGDFLACNRFDITQEVSQIRIPALMICGTLDKMTPPAMSEFLKDRIPGAMLSFIGDAGHMVMLEEPEAFNGVLRAFVESLPDGKSAKTQ
jgi:pimeloyl-ACP methyl ester carboxylesterase